jgi:glycosyltransferase involved in cell wall biosynthesis
MLSDLETTGGAAIAAARLAEGLCRLGHRVTRIVSQIDAENPPWSRTVLELSYSLPARLGRRLLPQRIKRRVERRSADSRLASSLKMLRPDVVNIHNLHRAEGAGWSPEFLSITAKHYPTIWTLHDMWSFTGKCTYAYQCRRFIAGCNAACPTAGEYPVLAPERIAGAWAGRANLFAGLRATAVAPSQWMAQEARSGFWQNQRIAVIPYGVDLNVFSPMDRSIARKALGIDVEDLAVLMCAEYLDDPRKGGHLLAAAMPLLNKKRFTLLTMGRGFLPGDAGTRQVHQLGPVRDHRLQVLAFNAADLLIHPAPVDNLPNTIIEAFACGTPVVAYRTGGIPDLVKFGRTGWLADPITPESLAQTLGTALDTLTSGIDLRNSCRHEAETHYGLDLQAQRYTDLFRELIASTSS